MLREIATLLICCPELYGLRNIWFRFQEGLGHHRFDQSHLSVIGSMTTLTSGAESVRSCHRLAGINIQSPKFTSLAI